METPKLRSVKSGLGSPEANSLFLKDNNIKVWQEEKRRLPKETACWQGLSGAPGATPGVEPGYSRNMVAYTRCPYGINSHINARRMN